MQLICITRINTIDFCENPCYICNDFRKGIVQRTRKPYLMKIFSTLLFAMTLSTLSIADNGTSLLGEGATDSDAINQENPENVKSKSVFISFNDKVVSLPVGFADNNQLLFGARFTLKSNDMAASDFDDMQFFISPILNGKVEGVYFSGNDGYSTYSNTTGRFLVSVNTKNNSDLYMVEFSNGVFAKPVKLSLNTDYNEINGTFSSDGEKIYFASDRPGGQGGYDIYETEMIGKNKWSDPRNIGTEVNTASDEQSPYMMKDGMTLYFSSKGHDSQDNFDIYIVIQGDDGTWGSPEKLGSPINTEKDDLFYRMSPDETRAVYYSVGDGGEGIYELIFN